MLTRLQIKGFKNLVDVDVRFGPFTCIAGCNGVGKSNLFDAIFFLGSLARMPLLEAAQSVRGERGRSGDIRHIFNHSGLVFNPTMSFIADMIIPRKAIDDLGQEAEARITFVRYSLNLRYRTEEISGRITNPIEILKEELTYIPKGDFKKATLFKCSPEWKKSVLIGRRTTEFISTVSIEDKTLIKLHQDGSAGRAQTHLAEKLPRTVLSTVNAAESPTALCARRELESWILLQLEPGALRKPDDFNAPATIGKDGAHLAATVHRLAQKEPESVYQEITNGLKELIEDVSQITIDIDDKRLLYMLVVTDKNGTRHPAHALSDGTLRFLALSVLKYDNCTQGLICLEEPENGIHPGRISSMISLLNDMAVETSEMVDETNPLRQVIVNTHSPVFVGEVKEDSLIMLENREILYNGKLLNAVVISAVEGSWRITDDKTRKIAKSKIINYLSPFFKSENETHKIVLNSTSNKSVYDHYAEQLEIKFDYPKAAEDRINYGKD
ncbi:MAG: AAA family ATPase [Chitinivibrionales bacterium]|nr:AAA family ATPase [Chitinivibrionales bacterium]